MCRSLRFDRVFHASFWKQSVKVGNAASKKLGPIFFRKKYKYIDSLLDDFFDLFR